jgi:hypothetical protein
LHELLNSVSEIGADLAEVNQYAQRIISTPGKRDWLAESGWMDRGLSLCVNSQTKPGSVPTIGGLQVLSRPLPRKRRNKSSGFGELQDELRARLIRGRLGISPVAEHALSLHSKPSVLDRRFL